jgi:general secretion pathway protein G
MHTVFASPPPPRPFSPQRRWVGGEANRSRAESGFTLIEAVITVAIIALLASIAAPMTETVLRRGKERDLKNALMTIRSAIDAYKEAADVQRVAKAAGDSGYPPSLAVLVNGVPDLRSPGHQKIYFLRRIPRDPFAAREVPDEDTWGLRSYDSPPDAPHEGKDVFDVYSLAESDGLNGIPYRKW